MNIRLATNNDTLMKPDRACGRARGPSVRLATTISNSDSGAMRSENLERAINAPAVRLAHVDGAQGDNILFGKNGNATMPRDKAPALLVSYVYLKPFQKNQSKYVYRDWALDSGAFSAHASGKEIKLDEYIGVCKDLMASDPTLGEIFSLDVIGDWRASLKNLEKMWKAGVPAIPCYHMGEPETVLKGLARDYPKLALGGVAMLRGSKKMEWAGQCFHHVWPKKIHGFGFGAEKQILGLPWHSVDATNWESGPCMFGRWNAFGNMSVRGSNQNLRAEVEFFLNVEYKARMRWKKEMALLDAGGSPSIKLAMSGDASAPAGGGKHLQRVKTFAGGGPTVRLANAESGRAGDKSVFLRKNTT